MSEQVDILLVTTPRPPQLSSKAVQVSENSAPPLGLLCVAASAERAGYRVAVHDFYQLGGVPRDVVELLERYRPRVVGISALTSGVHLAYRVCRHVKRVSPETVTVLGGPHATALPKEVARDPAIAYVVRGEGEITFAELAKVLLDRSADTSSLLGIPGLAFFRDGRVVLTAERQPLSLEELPIPARHLVPMDRYLQRGAVITSRGCTYRCWFCSSVTFNTHRYRYRSAQHVVDEMDDLSREYGISSFEFIEDTFTCVPDRVSALMALLEDRDYEWSCQATIPDLHEHPHLVSEMVRAGCKGLFFGIEGGNDQVLRKVKHMSRERVLKTIDFVLAAGVQHLVTSFIIGHPWDTRETIADTVDLIIQLRDRGAHTPVSILVPFPGSPIGKWPERFGVTVHSRDYAEYYYNRALISTKNLSRDQLHEVYLDVLESILRNGKCSGSDSGILFRDRLEHAAGSASPLLVRHNRD